MEENVEIKDPAAPQTPEVKEGFNKTPLLVAALVILTGVLLVVSLSARNGGKLPFTQNQTVVAGTNLSLSDQRSASVSGTAEIDVNIDAPKDNVNGVQLEITYDPAEVSVTDIRPGDFFSESLVLSKKIDAAAGVINFVVTTPIGQEGLSGLGTVAVITFSKTTEGESELSFGPGTVVTSSGSSESVLSKTVSGLVTSTSSQ